MIFVSFDTLRADHTGFSGYARNTTPTIDEFAKKGFVFTNAISASSWTLPSSMSWFTGVYPSKHKVLNKFTILTNDKEEITNLSSVSPQLKTLAEGFKENGYLTGGFTGGAGVHRQFGFDKGFDLYVDDKEFAGFEYTYPKAIDWIKKNKEKKLFVFLHGYNIHGQYVPDGGYDKRFVDFEYKGKLTGSKDEQKDLREEGLARGQIYLTKDDVRFLTALYDEKIQRADEIFSKFVKEYEKLRLVNKTVFVLTSDHGEELYEHGQIDHGHSLYDELIKVPLIITLPYSAPGEKIDSQVSSIDIPPTILDLLGMLDISNIRTQLQGKSLIPLIKGEKVVRDAFSETDYRYAIFLRSIRTADRWKLIKNLEQKLDYLFNLSKDKKERNNLSDQELSKLDELNKRLKNIPRVFVINPDLLSISKARIANNDELLLVPYRALLKKADSLFSRKPYSVTYKNTLPPSKDIHDYISIRPYVWPDDSGGYINIDGRVNPESLKYKDFEYIEAMAEDSFTLALAYYLSGNERYAKKATLFIKTWFIDKETRMNPNFIYAQSFPNGKIGDGGSIDGRKLPFVIDAIGLLSGSKHWSQKDQEAMEEWFEQLLLWFTTAKHQLNESDFKNNHGTWYDVQTSTTALFLGKKDIAKKIIENSKTKRINIQIEPDGKQPYELDRVDSYFYSVFNLSGLFQLARLGKHIGIDLWNYVSTDVRSIKKALDFLVPYATNDYKWPYQQKNGISTVNNQLVDLFQEAAYVYNDRHYLEVISKMNLQDETAALRNILFPLTD